MPTSKKSLNITLLDEDQVWEAIVEQRDTKDARYLPHDKAWQ